MLPSANADAPTSLSNLLLFGSHGIGESADAPTIHLAKRTAWSKKETARLPPVSQSRLPRLARLRRQLHERLLVPVEEIS